MTRIVSFTGIAVVGGFITTVGLVNLGITLGRSGRWSR